MVPPGSDVESKIAFLTARLERLERRLDAVESGSGRQRAASSGPAREDPSETGAPTGGETPDFLPLLGRTLLILGGAFVLRAVTENDLVGVGSGTTLGILYSLVWLVLADRAAAVGRRAGATFYGLSTAIIALPLIWEAAVRFGVFGATAVSALLALIAGLTLVVACRNGLVALAWAITLGSTATSLALAVATRDLLPFAALVVLLGLTTLWLEHRYRWTGLGWTVAVVADALLALMTTIVLVGDSGRTAALVRPAAVTAVLLSFVAVYFGTFVRRHVFGRLDLTIAEMVQGVAALVIGLGGAVAVARRIGSHVAMTSTIGLLLGGACYVAAFTFIDKRAGRRLGFIYYSSAALLLTLGSLSLLLHGARLTTALAAVAVLVASIGTWRARATLNGHGVVYVLGAAVFSGAVLAACRAFTSPSPPSTAWITSPVWIMLLAVAILCLLPVPLHGRTWGRFSRAPKAAVLAVLTLGVGGLAVTYGSLLLTPATGTIDAARLAVLRTGTLATAGVLLALAARRPWLPEAAWLVYPVLIAGGVKLLLEDVPSGRPSTLVISLMLYGGALILAPRLVRGAG